MGQELGRRKVSDAIKMSAHGWSTAGNGVGGLGGGTSVLVKRCWVLRSQNIHVARNQRQPGEGKLWHSGDRHGRSPQGGG